MSVWRSPVFYLGILLVIGVIAALSAPFVVNWNAYRDNLEAYARHYTGRDFAINGDISARLFPWPRLVMGDVSLGNPKGVAGAPMANAKTITFQLNLGGLINGDLQVETITVDQPVVTLSRLSEGMFNWNFETEQTNSTLKIFNTVKLDHINIQNGTLQLQDRVHNVDASLTNINALLSATSFAGPWRVRGSGNQANTPLSLSFNSTAYKAGDPFEFGVRVEPQDGSFPAVALDGKIENLTFKGKLRLDPVVTEDGRQSLEGSFKPLKMQSDIKATFDRIELDRIKITPDDSKDNGTLIEGTATATFEKGVRAAVTLTSPRLDLDTLAGSQSLRVWRAGGVMALLNMAMKEFPEQLSLSASLDVSALSAAGQTLENFSLRTAAEQSVVRISEISANLPGRSRLKFNGIVFPGETAAELGGSLAVESNDMREFTRWLWPEMQAKITEVWTGGRGRLKAQSDVTWSGTRFGFQNLKYELDGERGDAEIAVQLGKLAALDLKLNAKALDLDSYMAKGTAKLFQNPGYVALFSGDGGFEKRLAVTANKLRINGVEAEDVLLEFDSSLSGFEIKKLVIGSVEGAKLSAKGLVLQGPSGPSGDIKAELAAENPRGFLRLIGILQSNTEPGWASVLGATRLQGSFNVNPGVNEPLLAYDISGQSGLLQIAISGDVKDIAKGNDATLGIAGEIDAQDGGDIVRLFGISSGKSNTPGKLVITASGSVPLGYKAALSADILGAKFQFDGRSATLANLQNVNGKLTLTADDSTELGTALALPLVNGASGPTSLSIDVTTQDQFQRLANFAGTFASRKISGKAELDPYGKVNAEIDVDQLDLREFLSAGFMPWTGKPNGLDDIFSTAQSEFSGEVWLRPETLKTGFGPDLKMAVLGASFDASGRQVTVSARDKDAEPLKLNILLKPKDSLFTASGSLHMPMELNRVLRLQNGASLAEGSVIFDGTFEGEGRSPLAVMTALKSEANYVLRDAKLTQLSPQNFFASLAKVENASNLKFAFDALLQPPGVNLSSEQLKLSVEGGALNFTPLVMGSADAFLTVTPRFDFASRDFETQIRIDAKPEKDLPSLGVTYSGAPGALRVRTDTAAVATKLGYAFMARDLAALEKAQKEQARLAAEELAQQKSDEEKFLAYQAQRNELRLRLREQRVFAQQRVIDAERRKAKLAKAIKEGAALNALESGKFLQQINPSQ